MKIKPCMYEKVVEKFLNWREEGKMPAAVEFYKEILKTIGSIEFSEWAKIGYVRGDLSPYMLKKIKSDLESVSDIEALNTVEKRVKFLEDNQATFIAFAQERYVAFVLPLEQVVAMLKAGSKTTDCLLVLDTVMVRIMAEMGDYYRHFAFHILDRTDVCETQSVSNPAHLSKGGE
jgi:hypothetical protein